MEFQIGRLVKKKYIIAGIDQRVGVQRDQGLSYTYEMYFR